MASRYDTPVFEIELEALDRELELVEVLIKLIAINLLAESPNQKCQFLLHALNLFLIVMHLSVFL